MSVMNMRRATLHQRHIVNRHARVRYDVSANGDYECGLRALRYAQTRDDV